MNARDTIAAVPSSPSVLIVDDDLGTRDTFSRALTSEGFRVGTTDCGAAVFRLAQSAVFDLFIIDLKLPDLLGTDVIRMLRAECATSKIVLISGFLTIDHAVEAMKLGQSTCSKSPWTSII